MNIPFDLFKFRPIMLEDADYSIGGAEPNLREVLQFYYAQNHSFKQAQELAQEYIDKIYQEFAE